MRLTVIRAGLLGLPLMLCGCQTDSTARSPHSVKLELPISQPASFNLIDSRPADQRFTNTTGDPFGTIINLGDDVITPSRVEVFKARLSNALGSRLAGKTVTIDQFAVQIFAPWQPKNDAQREAIVVGAVGGAKPLHALLANLAYQGLDSFKTRRNLVGARISGRIGEREFFARHDIGSPSLSEDDVHTAIAQAMNEAIADIQRSTPR